MADLRERKKARTRAELIKVSQRLFHEHGFAATTLEQICHEVQIVPQTLLRYFDSKHKLALAPQYDGLRLFEAALDDADRQVDALETFRSFALDRAREAVVDPRPFELTHHTPELRNAQFDVLLGYERLLASWFAAEAGTDVSTDLDAQLLACLLVAGEHTVYRRWLEGGGTGDLVSTLASVITRAERAFPRPRPGAGLMGDGPAARRQP